MEITLPSLLPSPLLPQLVTQLLQPFVRAVPLHIGGLLLERDILPQGSQLPVKQSLLPPARQVLC